MKWIRRDQHRETGWASGRNSHVCGGRDRCRIDSVRDLPGKAGPKLYMLNSFYYLNFTRALEGEMITYLKLCSY